MGRGRGSRLPKRTPWVWAYNSQRVAFDNSCAVSGPNRYDDSYWSALASAPRFLRGDANDDGNADLSDASFALNWLVRGGPTPACIAAGNAAAAAVDLGDPAYFLNFLYLGVPPPVAPFPGCGESSRGEDDELSCEESSCT